MLDILREPSACENKVQMQRCIDEIHRVENIMADKEAGDIACGIVKTPQLLALVLDWHEVRSLINDTMFYMEHLAQRQGIIPKYEYEPRVLLLQKLQEFERKLGRPWGGRK